jgi:hypothetical protein
MIWTELAWVVYNMPKYVGIVRSQTQATEFSVYKDIYSVHYTDKYFPFWALNQILESGWLPILLSEEEFKNF